MGIAGRNLAESEFDIKKIVGEHISNVIQNFSGGHVAGVPRYVSILKNQVLKTT